MSTIQQEEKINNNISQKKYQKTNSFYEFFKEPTEDEIKTYLGFSDYDEIIGKQNISFVEFIIKDDTIFDKIIKYFKKFLKKQQRRIKHYLLIFNSILENFLNLIYKTKPRFAKKEKSQSIELEPSTRYFERKIEFTADRLQEAKNVEVEAKDRKEILDDKGEKIQFTTLSMLSSRMFTSGGMRTILTIMGISISIGVILFLVSFGYGLQKTVMGRITTEESLLSLAISLSGDELIDVDQVDIIKEKYGAIESISTLTEYNSNLRIDTLQVASVINMIDKDYFSLAGVMSSTGESLKVGSGDVIVSTAILKLLGLIGGEKSTDSIIGSDIFIKPTFPSLAEGGVFNIEDMENLVYEEKKFKIKDIIEDDLTAFAYLLRSDMEEIDVSTYNAVKVKVYDQEQLTILKEGLVADGYIVSAISDTVEETRKIFRGIQIVLSFFGTIALIISAIGMLNILTIVLLERTQEIGVMKAIGASARDIWKIVISDSVIIGFLGGVGGIMIGVGTSKLFNFAFNFLAKKIGGQPMQIFQLPQGFIPTIMIFSSIIGFVTGVWPAIRASKIPPLEAIRYK